MSRLWRHIRRNAYGLLALFVALSGTAYATSVAPRNSVRSKSIKNGTVRQRDLARDVPKLVTRVGHFPHDLRTVQCHSGERAVGGGGFTEGEGGSAVYLSQNYPVDRQGNPADESHRATGWHVAEDNAGLEQGAAATGSGAFVICMP